MSKKESNEEDKLAFASKLNYLFQTITKPDGSAYTHREVSNAAGVTSGYISQLRNGQKMPGYELIGKLATFFQVNPNYFYKGTDQPKEETMQQIIGSIALRASELEETDIEALIKMLEHIGKLKEETTGEK